MGLALLLTVFLTVSNSVFAQQRMLPVYDQTGGMGCVVVVDSIRLSRASTSTVGLSLTVSLAGIPLLKEDFVTLVPRLFTETDSVDFPALRLYGNWAYIHLQRSGDISPIGPISPIDLPAKAAHTALPYSQHTAYQPWMEQAQLKLIVSQTDGCGTEFRQNTSVIGETHMVLSQRELRTQETSTTRQLQGRAYISFQVNKTEILPDYGNNRRELEGLYSVLDSLRRVEKMDIRHLSLKGFASPEGSYAHNEKLARGRVESLRDYIVSHYNLSSDVISTSYEAEDWKGLREYVMEHTELPGREQILSIIDSDDDPDKKLTTIQRRHPAAYKQLKEEAFPLLRHTDYSINYSITKGTDRELVEVLIDTSYVNTLTLHDEPLRPVIDHGAVKTYRPILAVKSNLLYDLLLAPNIELELPLGRDARWSVMAEYTNPWWRWDRLDQSYEIQELGVELRHWFMPRCVEGRPCLSGHFWGVYGAVAKYDLERNEVGDQGDVFSAGVTYGYSWPLSARWNLELSASAGIVAGERRHYNAEFDSTHLIYKYTKNLFYAGPTKLKVSLVYFLGK